MSEIPVLDAAGKKISSVKLGDDFTAPRVSDQVVMDAVVALRANQRRGTAKAKTKSEVNFSGAKPWKQKGTGRARSGERSSPIWRKGAVAFGPRPRSYRKTVPKKVRQVAFRVALSEKIAANEMVLVEKIVLEQPKTKLLMGLLDKWQILSNVLILLDKADRNVELAARNLPGVEVHPVNTVTTYDVLRCKQLVTTPAGLDQLKARSHKEQ